MSGECDKCNEHALECLSEPLCRLQKNDPRTNDTLYFKIDISQIWNNMTPISFPPIQEPPQQPEWPSGPFGD